MEYRLTPVAVVKYLLIGTLLVGQSSCVVAAQILSLLFRPWKNAYSSWHVYCEELWSQHMVALKTKTKDGGEAMDEGIELLLRRNSLGKIVGLDLPSRLILISNHQVYADWIYLWCFAYMANAHGAVKIILKDALRKLPIFGLVCGMQFFDFIFLKRKLAADKVIITQTLERSRSVDNPMWLVIFPEGTVISENTRARSKAFADKLGFVDRTYLLLPRSTGLHLCMATLDDTVEYLYDVTVGYEGVKAGDIPEEKYTIRGTFFHDIYPKKVHMHLRRWRIDSIPVNADAFNQWLLDRWKEKDALLEEFYRTGKFPLEENKAPLFLPVERVQHGTEITSTISSTAATRKNTCVEFPVKLDNILDLTQVWFLLLPYVPLIGLIMKVFGRSYESGRMGSLARGEL
ncbi:hypothetical protein BZG36_04640 [Bifiguratus adelaidae]|uniref:Phospholipid/glycerol acyltransferase domain-containing protein n=1 Tax=Bifiguratus adelaidae TaxID=1938954 RepID=A0A261XXP0_9FUNG|nr:hypothetical protein BZG36_04640 [Bifiguratus adelaidae]